MWREEGSHLCSHPPLIFKQEEVLAEEVLTEGTPPTSRPVKSHPSILDSEPPSERRGKASKRVWRV